MTPFTQTLGVFFYGAFMDIMKKIKSADEGYELATIAMKYDLDGDDGVNFLQEVIKEYKLDE